MAVQSVKVLINGIEHSLTYSSSSGKWEKVINAPAKSSYTLSGGYYPVKVTATDSAGNSTMEDATSSGSLGTSLRLTVKEKVKPEITITSPGSGALLTSNRPAIRLQLRDTDSGINIGTFKLTMDSGTALISTASGMVVTTVSGGYDITYTPPTALSNGGHTVYVDVSDFDGNAATKASSSFTVDTVPPQLNVTSPASNIEINQTSYTVVGTTSDTTSGPPTVTIKVNGVDQGAITVSSGSFSKAITLKANQANTVVVTATDRAGTPTTVTRTITVNTTAPKILAVEILPNPVDAGATYTIKVQVE